LRSAYIFGRVRTQARLWPICNLFINDDGERVLPTAADRKGKAALVSGAAAEGYHGSVINIDKGITAG